MPLTDERLTLLETLRAVATTYVFKRQKRHHQLSDMFMLIRLCRIGRKVATVHGFHGPFRDCAADEAASLRELAMRAGSLNTVDASNCHVREALKLFVT